MCVSSQLKGVQKSAALRRASEGIAERRHSWPNLGETRQPELQLGGRPATGIPFVIQTVAAAVRRAPDEGQRNVDAALMFPKLVGMWHGISATERASCLPFCPAVPQGVSAMGMRRVHTTPGSMRGKHATGIRVI
jgi:hypothetical protein